MTRSTDRYSDRSTDRSSFGTCSQRVESREQRVEGREQRVEIPPLTRTPQGVLVFDTRTQLCNYLRTDLSLKVELRPHARSIAGARVVNLAELSVAQWYAASCAAASISPSRMAPLMRAES